VTELFFRGGAFFMLPLLGASIAVLGFSIERWLRYRKAWVEYDDFVEEVREAILSEGTARARQVADSIPGPVARVWSEGLQASRLPFPLIRERMEATALNEVSRLERHLPHIAIIGQLAPLVGILGTVWGMIVSFQVMERGLELGGTVDSQILAGGIWQALVTTAGGLVVAVPALILHHFLEARVDRFIDLLERSPADLIACLVPLRARAAGRARESHLAEVP